MSRLEVWCRLPDELMVEILSRAPVKSLCRFRCVSKAWHSLIKMDPSFAKWHMSRRPSNERLIFLSYPNWYTIEYKELFSSSSSNSAAAVKINSINAITNTFPVFAVKINSINAITNTFPAVVGSCNGLLLILHNKDTYSLLNPATRECKQLQNSPIKGEAIIGHGFGYDSPTDDYKVVRQFWCYKSSDPPKTTRYVCVYSLRTDSWRTTEDCPDFNYNIYTYDSPRHVGVLLNGALHWLVIQTTSLTRMISSFNLGDEKFRTFPYPTLVEANRDMKYDALGVLRDCISILTYCELGGNFQFHVWLMKEHGVAESWTMISTITIPGYYCPRYFFFPMSSGIIIGEGARFTCYDSNKQTSREVVIRGIDMVEGAMTYEESLVSPNYLHF